MLYLISYHKTTTKRKQYNAIKTVTFLFIIIHTFMDTFMKEYINCNVTLIDVNILLYEGLHIFKFNHVSL